jgi:transmembrane sensor
MAIAGSTGIEVRTLSEDQIQRALAWHDGMLYFDGETVEYAVAEFNRYNERKLVVADPAIAALRLGGQFRSTNTMGFAESLRQRFGVRVTEEADRIVLRAPSSPP